MAGPNDQELAAARGRITRVRLVFFLCLMMIPASFVMSCGGTILFLPAQDRAFGILPALVLPLAFVMAAFFARRPCKAAANEVAIIRWADENGLAYHRRADGNAGAGEVYKMGGETRLKFHMTGEVDGVRVELLNRWSRSGFAEVAQVEAEQTEAVIAGAIPKRLDFAIIPKGEFGEVNDLTRGERVRFPDDREFDRGFIVCSENPISVEGGLPERFANHCLKRPEHTVVARNGMLLVFRLNHVCTPEGYDGLLDHALRLARALQ